ncbi:MAG: hypothetical protein IJY86_07555 [Clostridia bacterium]|nr:hypothetical protein [Clostridia bacterium]
MTAKIFSNTVLSSLRRAVFAAAMLGSVLMVLNALDVTVEITGFTADMLSEKRNDLGFSAAYFPYTYVMHFFCGIVISWDCIEDFSTNNAELLAASRLPAHKWFFGKLMAYALLCFTFSLAISAVYFTFSVFKKTDYGLFEILDANTFFRLLIQCLRIGLAGFLTYSGLAFFFTMVFRSPAAGLLTCTAYRYAVHAFSQQGAMGFWYKTTVFFLPERTTSFFFGYTGNTVEEICRGLSVWGEYNAQRAWTGYLTVCLIGVGLLAGGYLLARSRLKRLK